METALIYQGSDSAIMPRMSIEDAIMRRQAIVDFTSAIMKEDRDYGKIPGTSKATLLKPGAEKLTTFFGLSPEFQIIESVTDWTGRDHDGEPFFYFTYRCNLRRGDMLAGSGDGSCNSWEKKYRYRKAERTCPRCGEPVRKSKNPGGGWYCWAKTGGCGATWAEGAQEIEGQDVGQVKNDNPADLVNTIQKMAQKRALVAATLIAVNASEFYTQDLEDYTDIIEADYTDVQPEQEPAKKPAPVSRPQLTQRKPPAKKPTNGGKPHITPVMLRELHAVGTEVFGDEWDSKRADISETFGKASSKDWSLEEYFGVLNNLKEQRNSSQVDKDWLPSASEPTGAYAE